MVGEERVHLTYHEFALGNDSTLIAQGTVNGQALYRAKFEQDNAKTMLVVARDGDHESTFLFRDGDDPDVSNLTISHDGRPPNSFQLSKSKFSTVLDLKQSLVGGDLAKFDLVGQRPVPQLTPKAMFGVFGDDPEFKLFLRGRTSVVQLLDHPHRMKNTRWGCLALCFIPACTVAGIVCYMI
jgi:hypothetical protein